MGKNLAGRQNECEGGDVADTDEEQRGWCAWED